MLLAPHMQPNEYFFYFIYISSFNTIFSQSILQDLSHMIDFVPVSTLTTILIASLTLLVVTQLPSTMSSRRSRILIGLTSAVVLGLGILILKGVLPLFVCVLSIIAILPKMRFEAPLVIGCILVLVHVSRRFVFDDLPGYYDVIQVSITEMLTILLFSYV